VRLRTTAVVPGTPLADDEAAGRFALPDDVEVAAELRELLLLLDGVRLELRSDHALNLLGGLAGALPGDRDSLIGLLDEFLALPAARQAEIALAVRGGFAGRLGGDRPRPAVSGADGLEAAKRLRARFL